MIWFFTRGSAQVDIEVRRGRAPATFELVVDYPDGSEKVASFTDAGKLLRRALKVQRRLIRQGWVPSPPADGVSLRRTRAAAAAARTKKLKLWSRLQKRVTARWAATFGL